jgi:hypothetical protein
MGARERSGRTLAVRLARIDWQQAERCLQDHGYARIPRLLDARQCQGLASLYPDAAHFRKRVDLERHRFGAGGDYQYFARPLPALVDELRSALYPPLARIANAWQALLGREPRYHASLRGLLAECRTHGQSLPTPLLLRYGAGGYNRLHQDVYGPVAFPLQLTCLLSNPTGDFEGGEFLLLEQRPRMQSRGEAVRLERGEAIVFPTRERPVRGARGMQRAQLRHGVSRIIRGERLTLGIIFHDAKT